MIGTHWCPCCLTDWFYTISHELYRIDKPNGSEYPIKICDRCIAEYSMEEINETIKSNMNNAYNHNADEIWDGFCETFESVKKGIDTLKKRGQLEKWRREYYEQIRNKRYG